MSRDSRSGMVPTLPGFVVERPQLQRLVDTALGGSVAVVTGAPGSGKTVLVADWCRRRGLRATWLNPGDAGMRQGRLRVAASGAAGRVAADVVVVDFGTRAGADVARAVHELAQPVTATAPLVVVSRRDPFPTPGGPVLHDGVVRISGRDLDFRPDEAAALLEGMGGRRIGAEAREWLVERAGGWAMALRIAAEALRAGADEDRLRRCLNGWRSPLALFFRRQVLSGQRPERVSFLLDTAVAEHLTGSLCDAMTGRSDSEEVLAELAAQNLFTRATPGEPPTFDYQPLFREFLSSTARSRHGERTYQMLRRSADWYLAQGRPRQAARQRVFAGQVDAALASACRSVPAQLQHGLPLDDEGVVDLAIRVGDAPLDPDGAYAAAASLLSAFRPGQARPWLCALDGLGSGGSGNHLAGRVEFLWALHDFEQADARGTLAHGRRASVLLGGATAPGGPPAAANSAAPWLEAIDVSIPSVLPALMARALAWRGEYSAARAALAQIRFASESVEAMTSSATTAIVASREGRLTEAETAARHCLSAAGPVGLRLPAAFVGVYQALGGVLRDRGDLLGAAEFLARAEELVNRAPDADAWRAMVALDIFDVRRSAGDHEGAMHRIRAVHRLQARACLPDHVRDRLIAASVRWHLDTGDLVEAARLLRGCSHRRFPDLYARLELASGRPERAASRLRANPPPDRALRAELERRVLLALAELRSGNGRCAVAAIRHAVEAGRPDGYVRPFTEEGADVAILLRKIRGSYADVYVDGLLCRMDPGREAAATVEPEPDDVLTDREREVLARLPTHLTQRQIAADLYMSVNTLKTHLKGLYRKLGAGARAEAVTVASARGLLPGDGGRGMPPATAERFAAS